MRKKNSKKTTRKPSAKRKARMEPEDYIEKGEEVLDLIAVGRNKTREARIVLNFLKSPIQPWLREAVIDALNAAAKRVKPYGWNHDLQGPDRLGLELLFTLAQGNLQNFSLRLSDRERVALAIEEILKNDETPERLYQDVGNFYTDISNQVDHDTYPKILEALSVGQCGFSGCPGAMPDGSVCPGPSSEHHKVRQLADELLVSKKAGAQ